MSRNSEGGLRSRSVDDSLEIGKSNFQEIFKTAAKSNNHSEDALGVSKSSSSKSTRGSFGGKAEDSSLQGQKIADNFNADDTFDTSKFYQMFSSKELQSDINNSPSKLSKTSFSASNGYWNSAASPVTPERAKSVGNLLFRPSSRVGFNSTFNSRVEHSGLRISRINSFSRFYDGSLDDSVISDQILKLDSLGKEYTSPVSLSSSPGPWQSPSFSNSDTGRLSSPFAQKSRFFPNKQADMRNHNIPLPKSAPPIDPMSLDTLEAGLSSLSVQKKIGSTSFFSASSSPLSLVMVPEFHPARESLKRAESFENFNLEPSMNSAHQAAAKVLDEAGDGYTSSTSNESDNGGIEIKDSKYKIPFVTADKLKPLTETKKGLQASIYTEANEEKEKEEEYQESLDNICLSLPKIPYSERSRQLSCPSILKYIRSIITRQPVQYMVYIASLPYDTPTSQCHELITQAFSNFGDITSAIKDEHSRWSKVSPEKDLFIRYRIVAKLFNDQRMPYKSHRFFNEVTGRDSKMLLFFDYSSSFPNGRLEKGNPFGYSKQDLSSYPEGFSSTFHKRGLNNFMFVRELQSKMIINKVRLSNTMTIDSAEFRVSLPIEELGLNLEGDLYGADDENKDNSQIKYSEDGRNSYRRVRRSYVVSIDVRDLENRPNYHHGGKFNSNDRPNEAGLSKSFGSNGKPHYNVRPGNRNYNKKK